MILRLSKTQTLAAYKHSQHYEGKEKLQAIMHSSPDDTSMPRKPSCGSWPLPEILSFLAMFATVGGLEKCRRTETEGLGELWDGGVLVTGQPNL